MDRTIRAWLNEATQTHGRSQNDSLRLPYTIYGCMLLLSPNAFENPAWQQIRQQKSDADFKRLYELIAYHFKITHIAINKPIPPSITNDLTENVVRSPINFTPLYGDFGPESASSPPSADDFSKAFWVTAKQNGIFQTWAPRWTMFSRGNISEKARLQSLPSVKNAVDEGIIDGKGSAAVDLYAGIGYFAFSYLKAGVEKVFCWDLNPWSIEGLRRGAAANKWSVAVHPGDHALQNFAAANNKLFVFNESNEHASTRIQRMANHLPPIRHVNCGLLPTSRGSWQTALNILDRERGGWVHVHENFAIGEIEPNSGQVRKAFQEMLIRNGGIGSVKIDCINRLKSYAPGVMHCVIDLYIPPNAPSNIE